MPSKRKKNKRRMRRVQAQRRALEEQYGSSGKGTPGVCAVSAPVTARVPVAKTSECPVAVPIPPAVVASVEVPPTEPVVLEVPVLDDLKEEVKTAEGLGQTLDEPPAKEPAVIEEDELIAVPVSEVTSSIDEPVSIPAKSEIRFEETTPIAAEDVLVQTLVSAQALGTFQTECEVDGRLPAEDPVIKAPVLEESVTPAETVIETVAPEAEPAVATAEVEGHMVGVVEEPPVKAEAISVELEPVEVHTVTEVTEVKEDVDLESAQDVHLQFAQDVCLESARDVCIEPAQDVCLEPAQDVCLESAQDVCLESAQDVHLEPALDIHLEPAQEEFPVDVHVEPAKEEIPVDVQVEPKHEALPVEAAGPTEALVEPEPEPQLEPVLLEEPTGFHMVKPSLESTSDPIAEESVVKESVVPVDTTVTEKQIPETSDAPEVVSETLAETIPAPEPLPAPVAKEIIQAQDEFLAQVETETIKDLSAANSRNVDAINGCLGIAEVAIEG